MSCAPFLLGPQGRRGDHRGHRRPRPHPQPRRPRRAARRPRRRPARHPRPARARRPGPDRLAGGGRRRARRRPRAHRAGGRPRPRPCCPGVGRPLGPHRPGRGPGGRPRSPPLRGRRLRRPRSRASPTGRWSPPARPTPCSSPGPATSPCAGPRTRRCVPPGSSWSPSPGGRWTAPMSSRSSGAPVRAEVAVDPGGGPGRRRRPAGQPPAPGPRAGPAPCRLSRRLEERVHQRLLGDAAAGVDPIGVARASAGRRRCSPAPSGPAWPTGWSPASRASGRWRRSWPIPAVSEVMVNGPGPVWVERDGCLARTEVVRRPADHRAPRGADRRPPRASGPTGPRPWSTPGCPTAPGSTWPCPRWPWTAPTSRSAASGPGRSTLAEVCPGRGRSPPGRGCRRAGPTSSWPVARARARPPCSTPSAGPHAPTVERIVTVEDVAELCPARRPRRPPRGPAGQRRSRSAPSASGTWSATPCACAPTASWSARSGAPRAWTSSRP